MAWRCDPDEIVQLIPDASTYLSPAHALVERKSFLNYSGQPEVARTPGYPLFVAALVWVVGKDLTRVLVAQAILLSLGVLLLYRLATKILPSGMAFLAGMLAALSPWNAFLATAPMTEGLFLFLLTLVFATVKSSEESPRFITALTWAGLAGALTGTAVLVRPIVPLVALIGLSLIFHFGVRRKGVWLLAGTFLLLALTPLFLWKNRNVREAHFNGISDISGKTAWRYLASRVRSLVNGQDRYVIQEAAMKEDSEWGLSVQEADRERWRRANAIFEAHPVLTVRCFLQSAAEHVIHPYAFVLTPARLNFSGDLMALASLWGALLILASIGFFSALGDRQIRRDWMCSLLAVCALLTLASGVSFGAGSRLRAPLEVVVPLLAAIGLSRVRDQIFNLKYQVIEKKHKSFC